MTLCANHSDRKAYVTRLFAACTFGKTFNF